MKMKQRIEWLEEKSAATVFQRFIDRMHSAEEDEHKISIGWELIQHPLSFKGKFDSENLKTFLNAFPPEFAAGIRRALIKRLEDQKEKTDGCNC